MLQAMYSGVSGLKAHQTKLNVSGNNIANVNTTGFKAGRATFQDQLSQTLRSSASPTANIGGTNPSQVGLGVALGSVDTLQTQGNLTSTGKSTDLAIQGNGFFMVSNGSRTFYTRDGAFDLDSKGVLVNSSNGVKLLGYVADDNGNIDTSAQIDEKSFITIPVGTKSSVKQTSSAKMDGNLSAASSLQSISTKVSGNLDLSEAPPLMTTTIYDADGKARTLHVSITAPIAPSGAGVPTGATQRWTVKMDVDGVDVPLSPNPKYLYAVQPGGAGTQTNYLFADATGSTVGSAIPVNLSEGAGSSPVNVDFSGLTATSKTTATANGQVDPSPISSTLLTVAGSLNASDGSNVVSTTTVYNGTSKYQVTTTLSNPLLSPAGIGVPVGATQRWDVKVSVDTLPAGGAGYPKVAFDSTTAGKSSAYYVPGKGIVFGDGGNPAASIGGRVQLVGSTAAAGAGNEGQQVDTGFPLTIDLSSVKTTGVTSTADGRQGTRPTWNASSVVYDSLGLEHHISYEFKRVLIGAGAPTGTVGRWEWTAKEGTNMLATSKDTGKKALFFDSNGQLLNKEVQKVPLTNPPTTVPANFDVALDFSSMTQLAGDSSASVTSQDGFKVGTLQSYNISADGTINGVFTNGLSRTLGQISTATFSNASGLEKQGANLYTVSSNSGLAQVGTPSTGGRGQISAGYTEMSNVDLSTEFTDLIVTQRGFQANTKIVTIVDELLQEVINLKR
ncbi:MAG: flagellar hook-basal body complex protein [Chthonomonadaceae bacterium]|nr:flagellar hook-basal body complex protein [Chthonomonadaceae bacterium]